MGLGAQLLFRWPESTDHTAQEQSARDEGQGQRKKKTRERDLFFFGWGHLALFPPPMTRRTRDVKVRTIFPAKSGSRRCQAAALSGHWNRDFWEQQEVKLIKYSSLALSSCISLDQGERRRGRRKHQAQGCKKQKMSPQPAKVRTILSAKPWSRRCQTAALSGRCRRDLWKEQEMKSIKYSGLAQSRASLLTTTTRALISTLGARKLHC